MTIERDDDINRTSVLRMAQEAGFMLRAESAEGQSDWWECFDEEIERFASLIEADAMAKERGAILQMSQATWFKTQADYDAAIRARGQAWV